MLECPKQFRDIHRFDADGKLYVADLDACQILEIDQLTWDILEVCSTYDNDQILAHLRGSYAEGEIIDGLQALADIEKDGLIFSSEARQVSEMPSSRMKILAPRIKADRRDITWSAHGASISEQHLLQALTKYADVYVTQESDATEEMRVTFFHPGSTASLLRALSVGYDGVLLSNPTEIEFSALLKSLQIPVVLPIREERGEDGAMINAILQWYASMRDFDAFMTLTESTKDFYAQFVMDTSLFHVIPNGVELDHFKPMEKAAAKREIAQILGKPELLERPIVGFLSRFHIEKGPGLYIKLAEMNPQYIFLVIVPDLTIYSLYQLPENLIYAGKRPRDELPLFYNAFDLFCFPSLLAETFSKVVLEAMACGVPPIVPNYHSFPHVVGDAGVLVPAEAFRHEIGSLAGYVCPYELSKVVNRLLNDDEERQKLSMKARKRAMQYSWDFSAQKLIRLFQQLNQKKCFAQRKRDFFVTFAPIYNRTETDFKYKSQLINLTTSQEAPLQRKTYTQSVAEGVALSLLKRHTPREVEAALLHLCDDWNQVRDIMMRVKAFAEATS